MQEMSFHSGLKTAAALSLAVGAIFAGASGAASAAGTTTATNPAAANPATDTNATNRRTRSDDINSPSPDDTTDHRPATLGETGKAGRRDRETLEPKPPPA